MDQAIECHVHPTWAEASPKVSINLKSEIREPVIKESPHAGNQQGFPALALPGWVTAPVEKPSLLTAPASSHFVPQLLSDPKELVSLQAGDLCDAFFSIIVLFICI